MAAGWNPAVVNQVLDSVLSAAAFTPPAGCFLQLHTGDPGAAGTANISSFTTRTSVTWASASAGSKSISASIQITASWTGTNGETVTHISLWSAVTGGTFVVSDQLVTPVTMASGQPLNLPNLTAPWSPLAA